MNNKIIGKHYKVLSIIGKGSFGVVYKATNIITNDSVAIKTESSNKTYKLLKNETTILKYLYDQGSRCIPIVYWYGLYLDNICLAITYYDLSLYDYVKKIGKDKFQEKINKIMMISIEILETIHKNFVIHRDIKPHNFMFKNGELFLIDFGFATFYIDDKGEHINNINKTEIIGTPNYVSYFVHCGNTSSRRDDLISLGYMYLFFILEELPWQLEDTGVSILSDHPTNIYRKEQKDWDNLRTFLDIQKHRKIYRFLEYCYHLKYDETPLYSQLCELFE